MVDLKPTEAMANAARRGLEMRKEASPSNRGGLSTQEAGKQGIGSGVARASSLVNRTNLSPQTVRQMHAFFSRHSAYKHKHKSDPKGKAKQSWLLWGGDAGRAWASRKVAELDRKSNKSITSLVEECESLMLSTQASLDIIKNVASKPVVSMKTGSQGRSGLVKKKVTDKRGHQVTRWVRPGGSDAPSQKTPRPKETPKEEPTQEEYEREFEKEYAEMEAWEKTLDKDGVDPKEPYKYLSGGRTPAHDKELEKRYKDGLRSALMGTWSETEAHAEWVSGDENVQSAEPVRDSRGYIRPGQIDVVFVDGRKERFTNERIVERFKREKEENYNRTRNEAAMLAETGSRPSALRRLKFKMTGKSIQAEIMKSISEINQLID